MRAYIWHTSVCICTHTPPPTHTHTSPQGTPNRASVSLRLCVATRDPYFESVKANNSMQLCVCWCAHTKRRYRMGSPSRRERGREGERVERRREGGRTASPMLLVKMNDARHQRLIPCYSLHQPTLGGLAVARCRYLGAWAAQNSAFTTRGASTLLRHFAERFDARNPENNFTLPVLVRRAGHIRLLLGPECSVITRLRGNCTEYYLCLLNTREIRKIAE